MILNTTSVMQGLFGASLSEKGFVGLESKSHRLCAFRPCSMKDPIDMDSSGVIGLS